MSRQTVKRKGGVMLTQFLVEKIKDFLGISSQEREIAELKGKIHNLTHIGVDVHFKTPSMILIYSRLNGGQIKHIDANFLTVDELVSFVEELKYRFDTDRVLFDLPASSKPYFKRFGI